MRLCFFIGGMMALVFSSCVSESPVIPRTILFGNPEKAAAQISPDGNRIAYLAPFEGVLNIWVRSIAGGDDAAVTREKGRGISNFFWAEDSQNLFFLQDQDGNEDTHFYAVDSKTGMIRDLTPFPKVRVQVIAFEKQFPDTLLIAMNLESPKFYDAYRLNWRTGELELAAKNDGRISQWIADADLKVRGALIANDDAGYSVMIRGSEKEAWKKSAEWGFEDSFSCRVIDFSKDGKSLYLVDSRDAPVGQLVRLDLLTGQKEILAQDEEYDVANVLMQADTRALQMVSWIKEKTEWQILDPSIQEDIKGISKKHGKDFRITSRDNSDQNWVLRVESDRAPVAYFLYRRATGTSEFLFEHQPELKKYKLAAVEPISLKSRDGLILHGYITFPPQKERKSLPLVLKVHGGPWSRDTWGYDPRVQWLANRGYICLQINFRGSTTYGKKFLNAGNREWGGKMQEDLTDAVRWAVSQGYADPDRVAIFGASYGGYAALAGAAFTPDLFKAAIAMVGPSNLITFAKTTPAYWATELNNIYRRVGDPDQDADFLKSRSPLFKANQIRIPILIAQGAQDPRVKKAESDQIVEALKKHGIQHEYLLFEDEGHGFAKPENQLKFYRAAEDFLARYLGGRHES